MLKRIGFAPLFAAGLIVVVLLLILPAWLVKADQDTGPTFGPIVIARDALQIKAQPIDVLDVYPSGVRKLVALFSVHNVTAGTQIDTQWFRNGEAASNASPYLIKQMDSTVFLILRNDSGLAAGDWELRVRYQSKVVATGKTKIANKMVIYPIKFGDDYTIIDHALINPRTAFDTGTQAIAAVFSYANLPVGAKVEAVWVLDDKTAFDQALTLDSGSGTGTTMISAEKGLTSGTYELRLIVNGQVAQSGQVTVK